MLVCATISASGVLMWHVLDGAWNGQAAVSMYKEHLTPALKKQYPGLRKFLTLEDNDPAGYKSPRRARRQAGVQDQYPRAAAALARPEPVGLWVLGRGEPQDEGAGEEVPPLFSGVARPVCRGCGAWRWA